MAGLWRAAAIAALALLMAPAEAVAQTGAAAPAPGARNLSRPLDPAAWSKCTARPINTALDGCTRVIQTAGEAGVWGARALYHRGRAYTKYGDFDRAIGDFTQAMRLAPRYAEAYEARARDYVSKGDSDRALADLNEAVRLKPNFGRAYYQRGWRYELGRKDHKAAVADFDIAIKLSDEAIRLKRDVADNYAMRGDALIGKGEIARGNADMNEALRLKPDDEAITARSS